MPALRIDVDDSRGIATINGQDLSEEAWAPIREALEFGAREVRISGLHRAELPVHSLLRARADLKHAFAKVRALGITPDFTAPARRVLTEATDRERSLAAPLVQISEDDLRARLSANGFARDLKPYQLRNVAKLAALPCGATFSVPGAGKTTEALALFALKSTRDTKLVVVCPKNAFAVWEEQIRLCLPGIADSVVRLRGTPGEIENACSSERTVFLINYDLVSRYTRTLIRLCLRSSTWVFLDESHRAKAWPIKVTGRAVLSIAPFAAGRLIMSGTPMPNAPSDLVPQYEFLYPESKAAPDDVVRLASQVFVRTTKSELDIPPLERIRVDVPMSTPQATLYRALSADLLRQLPGLSASDRVALRRIGRSVMRLIQAASEPALLANSDIREHILLEQATLTQGPKIVRACEIARRLASQGDKCLIWSNFVGNVLQVSSLLADLNAEYIYGDVQTSDDDAVLDSREAKIRRFKEDDRCYVLVANPAACAESISLHTVCHHAIYIDRIYNAGLYLQSEDRIHRLGLPKNQKTFVHLLVAPHTVDESVDRRLQAKVARMSQFLNDPGLSIPTVDLSDDVSSGFDQEDWEDLRRLLGVS